MFLIVALQSLGGGSREALKKIKDFDVLLHCESQGRGGKKIGVEI